MSFPDDISRNFEDAGSNISQKCLRLCKEGSPLGRIDIYEHNAKILNLNLFFAKKNQDSKGLDHKGQSEDQTLCNVNSQQF